MTALSHHPAKRTSIRPARRALARRSQCGWSVVAAYTWCAAAALTSSGCIIADPPDVQLPTKTPPLLYDANPLVTEIVSVSLEQPATVIPFTVRVRSEDLGSPLNAQPILNYNTDQELVAGRAVFVAPSSFDDTSRTIDFRLSKTLLDVGCEQFTFFVTHNDNFIGPSELIDPADVAIITWWLDVHTPSSSTTPATLDSCPKKSGSGSTGG